MKMVAKNVIAKFMIWFTFPPPYFPTSPLSPSFGYDISCPGSVARWVSG